MTRPARTLVAMAAVMVTAGVTVAGPAQTASADSKIDYESHSPPAFTLDVRPPDGYEVQVLMHNPMAYESRLSRATVSWGDGTTVARQLDPLALYTQIGFRHRYAGKPDTTLYKITVRLYDTDNLYREKSDYARIYPLFTVVLSPVRFIALEDCDFWFGKGDYTVEYWFEGHRDGNTGATVSADLDTNESFLLFGSSKTFQGVGQWDYPVFTYTWEEEDNGLDAPMPPARRLGLLPIPGTFTREYNDSQDGCDVRLRYTASTVLVQ